MAGKRVILIILSVALVAAIFLPGFLKLQRLREENRNLERRIKMLTKANAELQKAKEKLESDPVYIEKIAREKLGMVRKGEIILK